MFAMVMTFDGESAQETAAGVEHVQQEVLPAFAQSGGVHGWWLVDRAAGQPLSCAAAGPRSSVLGSAANV